SLNYNSDLILRAAKALPCGEGLGVGSIFRARLEHYCRTPTRLAAQPSLRRLRKLACVLATLPTRGRVGPSPRRDLHPAQIKNALALQVSKRRVRQLAGRTPSHLISSQLRLMRLTGHLRPWAKRLAHLPRTRENSPGSASVTDLGHKP